MSLFVIVLFSCALFPWTENLPEMKIFQGIGIFPRDGSHVLSPFKGTDLQKFLLSVKKSSENIIRTAPRILFSSENIIWTQINEWPIPLRLIMRQIQIPIYIMDLVHSTSGVEPSPEKKFIPGDFTKFPRRRWKFQGNTEWISNMCRPPAKTFGQCLFSPKGRRLGHTASVYPRSLPSESSSVWIAVLSQVNHQREAECPPPPAGLGCSASAYSVPKAKG